MKRRGDFFIVDMPTFAAVCDLGNADAAAAYLVLAAGTGSDNRTTTWSREAINKRTGLNWRKADGAMALLEGRGFIRWIAGKGTRKPRLLLPIVETRKRMDRAVAAMADKIRLGDEPATEKELKAAEIGRQQGWLECEDGFWIFQKERVVIPAFLPNELVGTGAKPAPGSRSIIDRIRLARDSMAFRLLIDLYSLQDLAEHGGVERFYLFKTFDRKLRGASGSHNVFEFSEPKVLCRVRNSALVHHANSDNADSPEKAFSERLNILEDAGAVEWVYYVVEDDSDASVRIHPLAVERHGKLVTDQLETVLGSHAVAAACGLLGRPDDIQSMDDAMPAQFLVPVERLARNATVRGVARMRSRAKTNNAAIWLSELE
jgi:hypothetical protein